MKLLNQKYYLKIINQFNRLFNKHDIKEKQRIILNINLNNFN